MVYAVFMRKVAPFVMLATVVAMVLMAEFSELSAQTKAVWSADEQPIVDQLRGLRRFPMMPGAVLPGSWLSIYGDCP
jgi:hypothetical protein